MKKLSIVQTQWVMRGLVVLVALFVLAVIVHRVPIVWGIATTEPTWTTTTTEVQR